MTLAEILAKQLDGETSYFRTALLREDLGRLERLAGIAARATDTAAFEAEAVKIGWTPDDQRTHELLPALKPLLALLYPALRSSAPADPPLLDAWTHFDQLRMDRLVGCLQRVPKVG